jgi:hypothetical protein
MKNLIYPVTIIYDRYGGTYSHGKWIAWNEEPQQVPEATTGDDVTCAEFWHNFQQGETQNSHGKPLFCGKGNTPEGAFQFLAFLCNEDPFNTGFVPPNIEPVSKPAMCASFLPGTMGICKNGHEQLLSHLTCVYPHCHQIVKPLPC